jgi:hypothetical protein
MVIIEDAYYASQLPLNLLCLQQWATQRNAKHGLSDDTRFTIMAEESKLSWSGGKEIKTIHYNSSNILVYYTPPQDSQKFQLLFAELFTHQILWLFQLKFQTLRVTLMTQTTLLMQEEHANHIYIMGTCFNRLMMTSQSIPSYHLQW